MTTPNPSPTAPDSGDDLSVDPHLQYLIERNKPVHGLHPLTAQLVAGFAGALAQKLRAAELKYGYSAGWRDPDWMDECRDKLREHVRKGDPRDVAAYCAFLWYHEASTTDASRAAPPPPARGMPEEPRRIGPVPGYHGEWVSVESYCALREKVGEQAGQITFWKKQADEEREQAAEKIESAEREVAALREKYDLQQRVMLGTIETVAKERDAAESRATLAEQERDTTQHLLNGAMEQLKREIDSRCAAELRAAKLHEYASLLETGMSEYEARETVWPAALPPADGGGK